MPARRTLWTAPIGRSLLDEAIAWTSAGSGSPALWIVPSSLAKEQVSRALTLRTGSAEPPVVWTFDDAWRTIASAQSDPPPKLSRAAVLTVLDQAITRARRFGDIKRIEAAVRFPGYRRQLLDRFLGWTRSERPLDGGRPESSPVEAEEFALFGHYRAVLFEIGVEDAEGWSVWMSKALLRQPPPPLRKLGPVVVLEPVGLEPAAWRLIDHCSAKARSMVVTLPFDPDPSLADLYASVEPTRKRLQEAGFIEEPVSRDAFRFRPTGLERVERDLFREGPPDVARSSLSPADGLKILGGPKGEGIALLLAREIREALDRGVDPEEILILAPRMDPDVERIRETLEAWGLPVDRGPARSLASNPAVSALRLAIRLPVEGWESTSLVRLLRNGQVRWGDRDGQSPSDRFEAASSVQMTRVFRDRESLIEALKRASADPKSRNKGASIALRWVEPLAKAIDATALRGTWRAQVGRVREFARFLGLEGETLEPLWDALDDQGEVRDRLGLTETLTWAEFVRRVEEIVAEVEPGKKAADPGSIRIEPVSAVSGARARVLILANLAELTFPGSHAIDRNALNERVSLAYSAEMLRFARVAGMADEQLILAYPTTDPRGETLLPAAFLDDLIRRLDPVSSRQVVEIHSRLDPVLIGHDDLARSPADARVLASALACQTHQFARLRDLATRPEHAEALRGAADAFAVAHLRRHEKEFGPHDGRLQDPRAIDRIRERFGPEHTFSASQLESFAHCPFQFYQRYVLGLKLVDERLELDEDYAGRGDEIHKVLEQIHQQASLDPPAVLIDRLTVLIETQMRVDLERHDGKGEDVAAVLREIATRRTNKALGRYVGQFRGYLDRDGVGATPHRFEVEFGRRPDDDGPADGHTHLTLGEGDRLIRVEGKIDRIDLIRGEDGSSRFRVIDYKTGSSPSRGDVNAGLASQLPLYALAVERLVFPDGSRALADFGYWSLRDDGFKPIKLRDDWDNYSSLLVEMIVELVAQLRRGTFPVESSKPDCRSRCDYQAACRVVEVRMAGKIWTNRPTLETGG